MRVCVGYEMVDSAARWLYSSHIQQARVELLF